MTKIAPIRLPNGTIAYMEVDEDVELVGGARDGPDTPESPDRTAPSRRGGELGMRGGGALLEAAAERVQDLTDALEGIVAMIPAAFKHAAGAEIQKVTLSFGIKMGGEAGIPYFTKGTAEGNIAIEVECRYPTADDKHQTGT
jgi:hypothetical protein